MSNDLSAYIERDFGPRQTVWRWGVVDEHQHITGGFTETRLGAHWAARSALRRIRAVRNSRREEIR